MITGEEAKRIKERAVDILAKSGLAVTAGELETMEIADFGLSQIETIGAQILSLADNEHFAVKLIVMLPHQVEPEHRHPPLGDYPGKIETLRCAWGEVYVYGPGEPSPQPRGTPPPERRHTYTVWHEHMLLPGEQVTFPPNTPHWFQGGPAGAVIWSFSTKARDAEDIFTDPDVKREIVVRG